MAVDIGEAMSEGLNNFVNKNVLYLTFAIAASYLLYDIGLDTLLSGLGETNTPLALASSTILGYSLVGVFIALVSYLSVVSLRVLASDEKDSIPESMYNENIIWPVLNLAVGSIIFIILVSIGFLLFVIPGIFLLVVLYFYSFEIAVGGKNFFEAMKGSYSLTKGNRIRLFALGLIVTVLTSILSILIAPLMLASAVGGTLLALITMTLYNIGLAAIYLLMFSIAAQVYNQLLEPE